MASAAAAAKVSVEAVRAAASPEGVARAVSAVAVGGGLVDTIRSEFELTPEQDRRLDEIMEAQGDDMRRAFQSGGGDREAMRARMQSIRAEMQRDLEGRPDA